MFFFDDGEPDSVDGTVGSVTTHNLFDFFGFGGHIWLEDVATMVLDKAQGGMDWRGDGRRFTPSRAGPYNTTVALNRFGYQQPSRY